MSAFIHKRVPKSRFFRSAKERSRISDIFEYILIRVGICIHIYRVRAAYSPRGAAVIIGVTSASKGLSRAGPLNIHFRGKKMGVEVFYCLHDYLGIERCKKSYLGKPDTRSSTRMTRGASSRVNVTMKVLRAF